MHTDVVIIGGGLAGLTCAVGLAGSGLNVTVVERSGELGGRARSWVDAVTGDTVDIGPHIVTTEHRNMFQLLERLGTRDAITWQTDKFLTMVEGARPVVMKTWRLPPPLHFLPTIARLMRVPSLSRHDVTSNRPVAQLAVKLTEDELLQLDALRGNEFLRQHGVSPKFIEWFWASVSMAILNVPIQMCSAGALMRFYRLIIGHDMHFGFATRGLGDLFVPGATQRLDASGARIIYDAEVKALTRSGDMATGVQLADGTSISASFCVAALPPQNLLPLVPAAWRNRFSVFTDLSAFEPSPYISVYLWFDRKLTHEQMWGRVYSPRDLNTDFYDLSNIRQGWRDRPSVIASNIIYSHRAQELPDDAIVDATVREIADYLPEAACAQLLHSRVHRIPMAIPCPFPGTEQKRPATQAAVRHLYFAGDWTRTHLPASMESAAHSGWLAAEHIWSAIGRPRSLALPVRELDGIARVTQRIHKTSSAKRDHSSI